MITQTTSHISLFTSHWRQRHAAILFALGTWLFALSPIALAVVPPPDGCYPGFTTAEGCDALQSLTTGAGNTALGWRSLFSNTDGSFNTAVGGGALVLNNGDSNTATGAAALLLNTTGVGNTANGTDALVFNDSGSDNTAVGAFALFSNTIGSGNTAIGTEALFNNITGSSNTANGVNALFSNTTGSSNTANGINALFNNTAGGFNTAVGFEALFFNTTGSLNTAIGPTALQGNTDGGRNIAIGEALTNNTTGSNNIALGPFAGNSVSTANNVICIGSFVLGENVSDSCYIGNISGQTASGGAAVFVNSNGKLGTATSSRRFKEQIRPMESASEAILGLRPVTFRYKKEIDPRGIPQFGLVAEEVERVHPDLIIRDAEGKPETVRYEQVNAMLLNEFLKEHQKVERLQETVAQQRKDFEAALARERKEMQNVMAEVKAQAAKIAKVNAQLQVSKPARQMVASRQ